MNVIIKMVVGSLNQSLAFLRVHSKSTTGRKNLVYICHRKYCIFVNLRVRKNDLGTMHIKKWLKTGFAYSFSFLSSLIALEGQRKGDKLTSISFVFLYFY